MQTELCFYVIVIPWFARSACARRLSTSFSDKWTEHGITIFLSYNVAVIQWITSFHKNRMTTCVTHLFPTHSLSATVLEYLFIKRFRSDHVTAIFESHMTHIFYYVRNGGRFLTYNVSKNKLNRSKFKKNIAVEIWIAPPKDEFWIRFSTLMAKHDKTALHFVWT